MKQQQEHKCNIMVSGFVTEPFEFSHESHGEKFDRFYIESKRESGYTDRLPCVISQNLSERISTGQKIRIYGNVRTLNKRVGNRNTLDVFIFVENVADDDSFEDVNEVDMEGVLVKQKPVRETPLGRTIVDLSIAINRLYGKSSYIPCIAWGRTANLFHVDHHGRKVGICGRMQSREYEKRLEDGTTETRTCYEVSVFTIEFIRKEKEVDEGENHTDTP